MLLFKPEHVPLILDGTKTQSRRLWWDKKKNQLAEHSRCKVDAIHMAKTMMLSRKYFAKLKILRVWKEKLGDISREDAIAEGYKDGNDYLQAFFRINKIGRRAHERLPYLEGMVWCVEWELSKSCDLCGIFHRCVGDGFNYCKDPEIKEQWVPDVRGYST